MKTTIATQRVESGTVLMVTLFIAFLFGAFLLYYFNLVKTQNGLVARSQAWNATLSLAEAGAEEALAQLNPGAPQASIDRTANGWGAASGGFYGPVMRSLSGGSYSTVITTDTNPIVYSTGYVAVPSLGATIQRIIRVATTNTPLFSVAMAAEGNINFNGSGVNTDSFNSANTNLSTGGQYDPAKTSTNGDVASVSGIVNVGNGTVNGSVFLGPAAADALKNNGTITGGTYNDFNFDFPDVILPQTTWLGVPLLPQIIGGITYQYVLASGGDYTINNLSGSVYVNSNVVVRLKLTGNASPSAIEVAGSGSTAGKLIIYMDGPTFSLSGNSSVDGGNAANLAYYGTPNNTSISLSGNAAFTGTIYAPEADFKLGGGGNNTYDFVGSSITKTVTMNGHFNFHFDENLLSAGPVRGYAPISWREL
jgi:hypothetical protein